MNDETLLKKYSKNLHYSKKLEFFYDDGTHNKSFILEKTFSYLIFSIENLSTGDDECWDNEIFVENIIIMAGTMKYNTFLIEADINFRQEVIKQGGKKFFKILKKFYKAAIECKLINHQKQN